MWTDEDRAARGALLKSPGLRPSPRWVPGRSGWTEKELALHGADHDEIIAKKIRRTCATVTTQRVQRKIPAYSEWPGDGPT